MSFESLGLSDEIVRAVREQGYDTPSPIQRQSIPAVLSRSDVMAAAQTGTGKTAGFTLPLLQNLLKGPNPKPNQVRALILTPTRELAAQVSDSVNKYGAYLPLRTAVVFGGVKINPQMMSLRKGVDILVATPGRLLDLHTKNAVKLDQLEVFVLDEADRMLDMGFITDIRKIIALLPPKRQNLLFSATFSAEIRSLAKGLINEPVEISVSPKNTAAKTVEQTLVPVDKSDKARLLIHLIKQNSWFQVLVFCRTKHGSNKLAQKLEKAGITASAIHGNKSQGARTRALAEFKSGDIQVLVATDIAARGLDIDQLPQVVNFDLPHVAEDYVHRIGRTGRAGSSGKAVSLVCADEYKELVGIERLIQQYVNRTVVQGFEPDPPLPASPRELKPIKAKKPKKTKNKGAPLDGQQPAQKRPSEKEQSAKKTIAKNQGPSKQGSNKQGAVKDRTKDNARRKSSGGNSQTPGNASRRPRRRPTKPV